MKRGRSFVSMFFGEYRFFFVNIKSTVHVKYPGEIAGTQKLLEKR
jgi:hypothetical protein